MRSSISSRPHRSRTAKSSRQRLMLACLAIPGFLCVSWAGNAAAQQCPEADVEALQWLDKMSHSVHQVNYHGVITFQRGGDDMQVMQVSHSVADGHSSEKMTQLTGQGAQVVRNSHSLQCVHPGDKLLRLGSDLNNGHCGIAQFYRFKVSEGDRVAGRQAVRVSVIPKDMYRYGYILDMDRSTGLLLKAVTIGHGSKVLELFQFASLSYDEALPQTADTGLVHRADHPAPGTSIAPAINHQWAVGWLPQGFVATDTQLPNAGRKTFTDGLAVFSIFIEELNGDIRPGEGVAGRGGTISYTRGMDIFDHSVLITVVGEVPVNTARMVADSINWAR